MDDAKRDALQHIFLRCTGKVVLISEERPEVATAAGQGAIHVLYKSKRTGIEYDQAVPSYLTPDGISTGLLNDLIDVWIMEYRNDFGEPPKGKKLLYEAEYNGLNHDLAAMKAAGFKQFSQDGLSFYNLDDYYASLKRYHEKVLHRQPDGQKK